MKTKQYDKKIFRIISILNMLDKQGCVKTGELAEEFGVNVRSIQRDLALINSTGFPIMSLEKGEYRFVDGFSLKKAHLSHQEACLLSLMKEITQNLGKELEDSFKALYNKVLGVEEESPYYIKIADGFKLDSEYPFIENMKEAIEESKKIYLCYLKNKVKKCFELDPLKLIFFNGSWYLLCRVEHKDSIIKLRLDNISDVQVLNKHFVYEDNLKKVLDESTNVWFQEKRDVVVKLKVDSEVAPYFEKKKYFPLQKTIKKHKDGSIIIETKIAYQMEVIPDILKWIPFVKVLSPNFIKNEIKQRINQYLKK